MTSRHLATRSRIELVKFKLGEDIIADLDRMVPMRDGVNLCVNVIRPREAVRYPVIIAVRPYCKDKGSHAEFYRKLPNAHRGRLATSEITAFDRFIKSSAGTDSCRRLPPPPNVSLQLLLLSSSAIYTPALMRYLRSYGPLGSSCSPAVGGQLDPMRSDRRVHSTKNCQIAHS